MSSSYNNEKQFLATLQPAEASEFLNLKEQISQTKYVEDLFYMVLVLLCIYVLKQLPKIKTFLFGESHFNSQRRESDINDLASSSRNRYHELNQRSGPGVETEKEETSKRLHGERLRLRQFMLDHGFTEEEATCCEERIAVSAQRAERAEGEIYDNVSPV